MDSDSDSNSYSSDTELSEAFSDSEEEETGVITSQFRPYKYEPLVNLNENMEDDSDNDLDLGSLTPAVLEARGFIIYFTHYTFTYSVIKFVVIVKYME